MAAGRFGGDDLERNHDAVGPSPDRIVATHLLIQPMTLGIVGDLCCEVEWIGLRTQAIRCGLGRSQDLGLIARLQAEMDSYGKRCLEIRSSLRLMQSSLGKGSLQVCLLEELLVRYLVHQEINRLD
tara:strand:- start:299 stop:676 length:378 start_codon:yes stop_codon:yes gene_type:complete